MMPHRYAPELLPPSVGGEPSANDNAGPEAPAPTVEPDAGDDDEAPVTVRDPALWEATAGA